MRDRNVSAVIDRIRAREAKGFVKYGVATADRTDTDLIDWLQHLQDELLDAVVYIEAAKRELGK